MLLTKSDLHFFQCFWPWEEISQDFSTCCLDERGLVSLLSDYQEDLPIKQEAKN